MASDDEEFKRVYQSLHPSISRFLHCMLASNGLAQEVTQETFLRLYKYGVSRLSPDEVRFWLFRVARNLALNELKRNEVRVRFSGRIAEAMNWRVSNPEEKLLADERQRILLRLLRSLPEHQRTALLLREQEEMSYREIAAVLDISESKVKVDIFRARNSLREKWGAAVNPDVETMVGKA